MTFRKPKLIVFDLDYTLWPFWIDTHVVPPFRKTCNDIVDAHGTIIKYYPEVPKVLKKLHGEGYLLAVASRTSEIQGALQLLDLFGWNKYFNHVQIFPGSKVSHFRNIKRESGCEYTEMMFFDDEHRNIMDINKLGPVSILVKNGVDLKIIDDGLNEYSKRFP